MLPLLVAPMLALLGAPAGCASLAEALDQPAGEGPERVFEVAPGTTARALGPELEAAGLVRDADRWALWLRLTGRGDCLKAGRFRLSPAMRPSEILATLCGAPLAEEVPFTVVEGWRIADIDAALARAGLCPAGAYARLATDAGWLELPFPAPPTGSLEGYLYPDTYQVPARDLDPRDLVRRQVATFWERLSELAGGDPLQHPQVRRRGLHAVVTVASMVEREEPDPANRPLVAGILYKRLDNGWKLGVDATSRYTLARWNDRRAFLQRLRDPDDPYNTRLRDGLPPGPIGNPGASALRAALEPADSPYWYYLHDREGRLHPSRSAREHEALRRRYGVY